MPPIQVIREWPMALDERDERRGPCRSSSGPRSPHTPSHSETNVNTMRLPLTIGLTLGLGLLLGLGACSTLVKSRVSPGLCGTAHARRRPARSATTATWPPGRLLRGVQEGGVRERRGGQGSGEECDAGWPTTTRRLHARLQEGPLWRRVRQAAGPATTRGLRRWERADGDDAIRTARCVVA